MDDRSLNLTTSFIDQIVVPGDVVLDLSSMSNQTIKLGGGLRQDCDTISVMKAGKLKFSKPNKYWVESSQKRYVPCVEDTILGTVVDSKADNFLVDIKGPTLAFLPVLAFEGGTRRNIPKYEAGTLLYVRVVKANAGMNPELSCTDGQCCISVHGYPCLKCNHELRIFERGAAKNHGGKTYAEISVFELISWKLDMVDELNYCSFRLSFMVLWPSVI
ncbi:PREDICTED: putative exosome complex component rrp40 isoform X2 [Nelumbo nucifera]|uniref:Exosome complex component rrp40 isoform X2 n=1 Tax=Nelumbo nucifera TaxID=4432 RepID=A0A1U7ZEL8_NELNU|nr:PREDICTED: putative exosome complex component rrp40 isoform X2 [Nelumbo nucifera]